MTTNVKKGKPELTDFFLNDSVPGNLGKTETPPECLEDSSGPNSP